MIEKQQDHRTVTNTGHTSRTSQHTSICCVRASSQQPSLPSDVPQQLLYLDWRRGTEYVASVWTPPLS